MTRSKPISKRYLTHSLTHRNVRFTVVEVWRRPRSNQWPTGFAHSLHSVFSSVERSRHHNILSKRWKSLWLTNLILGSDQNSSQKHFTFSEFFDSFMKNPTDETLAIFSFNITCMFYNSNIEKFVSTAIKRRVKNLTIDLSRRDLPEILIRSKTLVFLKLKKNIPSIYLPLLKALHMEFVTFSEYKYLTMLYCDNKVKEFQALLCVG